VSSDNPIGADNQQGSRKSPPSDLFLTPQRLHAELLAFDAKGLEAYLLGALHDGTQSALHHTHRIGQSSKDWIDLLSVMLDVLGHKSWIYREGRDRDYWVVETTASFLTTKFDASPLVGAEHGLAYVRGYFDAEGGMPTDCSARLYFQLCQKDRRSLEVVQAILDSWGISSGRIHNPSRRVDPDYWRLYIATGSHQRFMTMVGSWHPRKRQKIQTRMKI